MALFFLVSLSVSRFIVFHQPMEGTTRVMVSETIVAGTAPPTTPHLTTCTHTKQPTLAPNNHCSSPTVLVSIVIILVIALLLFIIVFIVFLLRKIKVIIRSIEAVEAVKVPNSLSIKQGCSIFCAGSDVRRDCRKLEVTCYWQRTKPTCCVYSSRQPEQTFLD